MVSIIAGNTRTTQPGVPPQPRLVKAAHEFEAQMMKELLKPMSESTGMFEDEDGAGAGATGALGEFATEALSRGLSERGGLGIAERIILDLSPNTTVRNRGNAENGTVRNPE